MKSNFKKISCCFLLRFMFYSSFLLQFNYVGSLALAPLFVKVWRMHKLLTAGTGFHRTSLPHSQAFLYTIPIMASELILLSIFSIVDPPLAVEELGVGEGIGVQQITCQHQSVAYFATQATFDGRLSPTMIKKE
jgi:hypothetical protein